MSLRIALHAAALLPASDSIFPTNFAAGEPWLPRTQPLATGKQVVSDDLDLQCQLPLLQGTQAVVQRRATNLESGKSRLRCIILRVHQQGHTQDVIVSISTAGDEFTPTCVHSTASICGSGTFASAM